jgi:hypothetical protein
MNFVRGVAERPASSARSHHLTKSLRLPDNFLIPRPLSYIVGRQALHLWHGTQGEGTMADIGMVILTLALFAVAGVYIAICDRL